ncbi:MAG: GAF domain-containing protein, partial [Rhodospirillales bacterium]|nr:GAF domain-containing protein [Acetobacter sp.]
GKLTPEEFEKMKIHPVVGADILERVRFPYPVVPMVRSHHEWWNGAGYPDGLAGLQIPIGARILTVVDCFDALVSDRPYRKGLSSAKAMEIIRDLSGKQFDPAIVQVFENCFQEAETHLADAIPPGFTPLNMALDVSRGMAPGAGFAVEPEGNATVRDTPARTEAGAEQNQRRTKETRALPKVAAAGGERPAQLPAFVSDVCAAVPCDGLVFWLKQGEVLQNCLATGVFAQADRKQTVPLGEGISGWVAQNGKALLNGNATVEPGCPELADGTPAVRSAISVPLFCTETSAFAVLTLYSGQVDAFTRQNLRLLLQMAPELSASMQRHLTQAAEDVRTGFGVPEPQPFFLQLGSQVSLARDDGQGFTVVLCEIDGGSESNGHYDDADDAAAFHSVVLALSSLFKEAPSTVARIEGRSFGVLFQGALQHELLAERISLAVVPPVPSEAASTGLRIRTGSACYPADGLLAEELLAVASRRRYGAKELHLPLPYAADLADTPGRELLQTAV